MTTKLYVGNLASTVTEQDLKETFGRVGSCSYAAVLKDRHTGESRGFGFVQVSDARTVIRDLDGTDLHGKAIRISPAEEHDHRPARGRGWGNR